MAVLKSPRNSRQKIKWAKSYALKTPKLNYQLEERKSATIQHKLNLFLRDSAHWVVSSGKIPQREPLRFSESIGMTRNTPIIIRYGDKFFDPTRSHPFVLRKYFRQRTTRENLTTLINSTTLL